MFCVLHRGFSDVTDHAHKSAEDASAAATKSAVILRTLCSKTCDHTHSSGGSCTSLSVKCGFSFRSNDGSKLISSVLSPNFLVHAQVKRELSVLACLAEEFHKNSTEKDSVSISV